jgi:hypothetical protein
VEFALQLRHFADHEQQVLPHPPCYVVSFGRAFLRKSDSQILLDHPAANPANVSRQPGQPPANGFARFDANRLDEREREPDDEIFGQMAKIAEGHSFVLL